MHDLALPALKAGANDFLAKPYSSAEMSRVIIKNLANTIKANVFI